MKKKTEIKFLQNNAYYMHTLQYFLFRFGVFCYFQNVVANHEMNLTTHEPQTPS